ncbi:MAG: caspase family protein [Planctomycetota bacterium]
MIGINEYQGVWDLKGALNDVAMLNQVLTSKFGFKDACIATLTDGAATRDAILAALRELVREAGSRDIVYIHYSGHGSQVKDRNGDETFQDNDDMDETLIPHDGRTGTVPDITDDELGEILSGLRTRNVVIALDSCHSGTATRSLMVQSRSVPPDERLWLYPESTVQTRDLVQTQERYVLMTGAKADQEALDGPIDGKVSGFFSFALATALDSAAPNATPREIQRRVEHELRRIQEQLGRSSMPEPQFEMAAEGLDQPLLAPLPRSAPSGGKTTDPERERPRRAWVEVTAASDASVRLLNGVSLGAVPGSIWAVYQPGEIEFLPGKALATAKVTETSSRDALASVLMGAAAIQPRCRAVKIASPVAGTRVPCRFLAAPEGVRASLENRLRERLGDAQIDIVGEDQFARFLLEVAENVCRVYGADGLQLVDTFPIRDEGKFADSVGKVIARSQDTNMLLSLDNPNSEIELQVTVAISGEPTIERIGTRGIRVTPNLDAPCYRIRKGGEPRTPQNSLMLQIDVSVDCYLTIVDVDSEGGVNLLFPNDYQKPDFYSQGRVSGGTQVRIPDSLEDGNLAGFNWDFAPPPGLDTVRVFACTEWERTQEIRDLVKQMSVGSRGSSGARTSLAALHDKLATRGIVVVPNRPPEAAVPETVEQVEPANAGDWTAASITLRISE